MDEYAVITAVGPDRPGLVDLISRYLLDAGCNLEDSRMAMLGGEFAMVILVKGSAAAIDAVLAGAEGAGAESGLAVLAKRTHAPGSRSQSEAIPYQVNAYSMDHPGIVQQVAHFLGAHKINVRALDTRVTQAPITGQPLFTLRATIDLPAGVSVREIRRGLEDIGAAENIDIELKPADR
ncbi:MAG: ACT domain-containing protein [bacterium]